MKSFISLEEAIEILDENIKSIGVEEVSLVEAIGRRISSNIYSNINNPPFNKSSMDGYAVKVPVDYKGKEKLEVIDTVFAGGITKKEVEKGIAIKIMTGAMIPQGANAVVKQEDVSREDKYIILNKDLKCGENICLKGEDIKKDTLLISEGKVINYADLGILASAGISKVKVYTRPKVALITTGDEVMDVDNDLSPGKIYNSNKYTLLGRVAELGYEVSYIDHEGDDVKEIGAKIKVASEKADIIFTTGGVSVGEKDLIKEAITCINGEKLFWKICIKPGSALLCSKVNSKIIISLSGNPGAALTTFELLGRTSLEKLSGSSKVEIKREKAILTNSFNKVSLNKRFLRGRMKSNEYGQSVEITQVKSGNGILSSALNSNCLIEINAGNKGIESGEAVEIIML